MSRGFTRLVGAAVAAAAARPRFRSRPWPEAVPKTLQTWPGASSKLILLRFNPHFSKMSGQALRDDFLSLYMGRPPIYELSFVEKEVVHNFLIYLGVGQSILFVIFGLIYFFEQVRKDMQKPESKNSSCPICKATIEGLKRTYKAGLAKEILVQIWRFMNS